LPGVLYIGQNPFRGGSEWVLLHLRASTGSKSGGMLQPVQDYYHIANFLSQEFSEESSDGVYAGVGPNKNPCS